MARRVRSIAVCVGCALLGAGGAQAQGRGSGNWTTAGYDAQRSFWVRSDPKISPDAIQKPGFGFLWKIKLEDRPGYPNLLSPMVILDPYTGYRGHKSLGFLSGSSDDIFGIDIDLGVVEWHNHLSPGLKPQGAGSLACPGGMTSAVARPTNAAIQPVPGGRGGNARSSPAQSGVGQPLQGAINLAAIAAPRPAATPVAPAPPASAAVVRPNAVYAIASDGMLRTIYVSNGADAEPPVKFLPPHANVVGLIVVDNVAYAETAGSCGGAPNGVWALDPISGQVTNWNSNDAEMPGTAGPAFGPDGTLYVTAGHTLAVLEPRRLTPKSTLIGKEEFTSSPVVFQFRDRILVAAATRDGSIYLVDTATMTAIDKTQSGSIGKDALASWQDTAGTRWILAADSDSVSGWKVVDQDGAPRMQPAWGWSDLVSPLAPIIVNGVGFVLSSGEPGVLYAVDPATGKRFWDSGKTITSPVHGGGLSAGGSQIYLETDDGMLYAFGFPIEH